MRLKNKSYLKCIWNKYYITKNYTTPKQLLTTLFIMPLQLYKFIDFLSSYFSVFLRFVFFSAPSSSFSAIISLLLFYQRKEKIIIVYTKGRLFLQQMMKHSVHFQLENLPFSSFFFFAFVLSYQENSAQVLFCQLL